MNENNRQTTNDWQATPVRIERAGVVGAASQKSRFRRGFTAAITASILTGVALAVVLSTVATAAAAPAMNLSFQTSSGNSAGWVTGPGSSSSEAYLTINNATGFSFAVITVHHFPTALPSTTPAFVSPQYKSGTPRIFIDMADGNYVFIYGDTTVECILSGVSVYPCSYSGFYSTESSSSVSAVYIVADTSQAVPYTAYITCFQYNSDDLIGSDC
jgi:hypothetical protein